VLLQVDQAFRGKHTLSGLGMAKVYGGEDYLEGGEEMSESISEILFRIAGVLQWLGKYSESKTLTLLGKYCRDHELVSDEDIGGE
jgi:hypothetical protein